MATWKPDPAPPKLSEMLDGADSETYSDGSKIAKVGDTVVLIEARSPYSAPDSMTASSPEKQTNSSGRK